VSKPIEYRAVATSVAPIEQRAEGDKNVITGYGAVFYNSADPGTEYSLFSDMVERIGPNAFDDALNRDDVRGLFNHDSSMLLGRMGAQDSAPGGRPDRPPLRDRYAGHQHRQRRHGADSARRHLRVVLLVPGGGAAIPNCRTER
jgi:hypothetical protein